MNPVEREKRSKFHALPGVSIVFTLTSFLSLHFGSLEIIIISEADFSNAQKFWVNSLTQYMW